MVADSRSMSKMCIQANKPSILGVACLAAVFSTESLVAANLEFRPWLSVSETYTDNVTLATNNTEEEFITEISPAISIHSNSRKHTAALDYRLENLIYSQDSSRNESFNHLLANSNTELFEDLLFFDADAFYTQHNITPEGRVAFDNLPLTENRTDVWSYGLSPYVLRKFGAWATLMARYQYKNIDFAEDPLQNRQHNNVSASLESGEGFGRFGWSVAYSREEEDRDALGDSTFEISEANLSFQWTPKVAFLLGGGYEDNEYVHASTLEAPVGEFWNIGMRWTPSARTMLEGRAGERYFGSTYSLLGMHQTSSTNWYLKYTDSLQTTSQWVLDYNAQQLDLLIADPADPDVLVLPELPESVLPSLFTTVFRSKRMDASVTWAQSKTELFLRGYHEERVFQDTDQDELVFGATTGWKWMVRPRTSTEVKYSWIRRDFMTNDRSDDVSRLSLMLIHELRPAITGTLGYITDEVESNIEVNSYKQNVIFVRGVVYF